MSGIIKLIFIKNPINYTLIQISPIKIQFVGRSPFNSNRILVSHSCNINFFFFLVQHRRPLPVVFFIIFFFLFPTQNAHREYLCGAISSCPMFLVNNTLCISLSLNGCEWYTGYTENIIQIRQNGSSAEPSHTGSVKCG